MVSSFRYRIVSIIGAAVLATIALLFANLQAVQEVSMAIPVYSRLPITTLENDTLVLSLVTVLLVQLAALLPLFKPRPRRVQDTIMLAQERVLLAAFALATIGYFDYTYRLPRTTLVLTTAFSLVLLPAWFVVIRRERVDDRRTLVVGDDPGLIATCIRAVDGEPLGYVAPNWIAREGSSEPSEPLTADGGAQGGPVLDGGTLEVADATELGRLGGLSRLDDVLVTHEVGAAVLAFRRTDRGEFFGALETCYANGVTAMVHRDHVRSVLTREEDRGELVRVQLEPLDWQDQAIKRTFDVGFSLVALVILAPVMLAIAAAVKLDSPGPALYAQERTASLGETFTVYKFRTMVMGGESDEPTEDHENDRITRVGNFLRKTHLDEIPQLWSILVGDMSVVGPRAAWTDEEARLESDLAEWRKRWFVKPGLTGFAQVNDASSVEPKRKLEYDVHYIRRQSFWFDVKILVRQFWQVGVDVVEMIRTTVTGSRR